ncbi:MAG: hypothetical protein IT324_16960 [Anaerolineae bacterium]|nr:hypothetical protein [Anaerolineae bacterium]
MINQTVGDQRPVQVYQPEIYGAGSPSANPIQPKRIARTTILAASLCAALIIVVSAVIVASRRPSMPQIMEPPAILLPGNRIPDDAHCDYHPFLDSRIYCSTTRNGSTIYLSYDLSRQAIIDTVIFTNHMTIGELIQTWGAPTGYTRAGAAVQVYWGNRSAYIFVGTFSPNSRTSFITYSMEPHETSDWRGFVNQDN